jgi:hypothetical protein
LSQKIADKSPEYFATEMYQSNILIKSLRQIKDVDDKINDSLEASAESNEYNNS